MDRARLESLRPSRLRFFQFPDQIARRISPARDLMEIPKIVSHSTRFRRFAKARIRREIYNCTVIFFFPERIPQWSDALGNRFRDILEREPSELIKRGFRTFAERNYTLTG